MDWLYALGLLVIVVLLAPLWSWMLRDMRRRGGGGLGPALGELNAAFDPSSRHPVEVREQLPAERPKDDPPT